MSLPRARSSQRSSAGRGVAGAAGLPSRETWPWVLGWGKPSSVVGDHDAATLPKPGPLSRRNPTRWREKKPVVELGWHADLRGGRLEWAGMLT